MNFRPLLVGACACAAIAFALVWQSRRPVEDRSEALVGPSAANPFVPPPGAVPLEPTDAGRNGRAAVPGQAPEAPAAASPAAPVAPPTPEQLLAARARVVPPATPTGGLQSSELGEDPFGFEAKYAGQDTAQIKLALDAVEAILAWQLGGGVQDKSQMLPAEELAALQLEQQWLKQKAFP